MSKEQRFLQESSPSSKNPFSPNECDSSTSGQDVDFKDELGLYDVVCGSHKAAFNNIGNRRFRVTISLFRGLYMNAPTRKDKSTVIKNAAALVRSNGGRFLQRTRGDWVELNDRQSHEKVGHALRNSAFALARSESSSSSSSSSSTTRESPRTAIASTFFPSTTETMPHLVSSERDWLQEQVKVKHSADPVVQDMEASAVESFDFADNQYSNKDTLIQDDQLLAYRYVYEAKDVVEATPHIDVANEPTHRDLLDSNFLSWLVDDSDFTFDHVDRNVYEGKDVVEATPQVNIPTQPTRILTSWRGSLTTLTLLLTPKSFFHSRMSNIHLEQNLCKVDLS